MYSSKCPGFVTGEIQWRSHETVVSNILCPFSSNWPEFGIGASWFVICNQLVHRKLVITLWQGKADQLLSFKFREVKMNLVYSEANSLHKSVYIHKDIELNILRGISFPLVIFNFARLKQLCMVTDCASSTKLSVFLEVLF